MEKLNADGDNMRRLILLFSFALGSASAPAQVTKLYPWQSATNNVIARASVYHPEPILFVHGVNANDEGWGAAAIPALQPHLASYDLPFNALSLADNTNPANTNRYRSAQQNFLHTFNYGDAPGTNTHNQQSYDHIEYNVLDVDKNNLYLPRSWGNVVTNPPGLGDFRVTLEKRIEAIRDAYTNPGASSPNLVLVAHSMGGFLSHYYMISHPNDHGVRRVVTLSTLHLGSTFATWLMWYDNTGGTRRASPTYHLIRVIPAFTERAMADKPW